MLVSCLRTMVASSCYQCSGTFRVIRPKLAWALPADENIWFRRQVAYQMSFWAMVHTAAHYVNFLNVERTRTSFLLKCLSTLFKYTCPRPEIRKEYALQIHYTQAGGITGYFMLLVIVLMYSTAHRKIRNQCFEAFWYTHHLAFFFMIALYSHATGCFVRDTAGPDYIESFPFYSSEHCLGYESWRFLIWVGIVYIGERVWRKSLPTYRFREALVQNGARREHSPFLYKAITV